MPWYTTIALSAIVFCVPVVKASVAESGRLAGAIHGSAPVRAREAAHPSATQILKEGFQEFSRQLEGWSHLSTEAKRRAWFALEALKFEGDEAPIESARDFLSQLRLEERAALERRTGEELARALGLEGHLARLVATVFDAKRMAVTEPLSVWRKARRLGGIARTPEEKALLEEYKLLQQRFGKYWAFYKKIGLGKEDAFGRWVKLQDDLARARRQAEAGEDEDAELAYDKAMSHALQMWNAMGSSSREQAQRILAELRHGDPDDRTLGFLEQTGHLLEKKGKVSEEEAKSLDSGYPGMRESYRRVAPVEESRVSSYRQLVDEAIVETGVQEPGKPERSYKIGNRAAYRRLVAKYSGAFPWAVRHRHSKLVYALAPKDESGENIQIGLRPQPGAERLVRAASGARLTPDFHGVRFQAPATIADIAGILRKINEGPLRDSAVVMGRGETASFITAPGETDLPIVRYKAPRAPKPTPKPEPAPGHDGGKEGDGGEGKRPQPEREPPGEPSNEPASPELEAFCRSPRPSVQICSDSDITKDYDYHNAWVSRAFRVARGLAPYSKFLETLESSLPDGIGQIQLQPYAEGEVREALRAAIAGASSWLPDSIKHSMDTRVARTRYLSAAQFMREAEKMPWDWQQHYHQMLDNMCQSTKFTNFSTELNGPVVVTCPGSRFFALGLKYESGSVNDANFKDSITYSLSHEFGHSVDARHFAIYENLAACLRIPQAYLPEAAADYWAAETLARLKPALGRNALWRLVKHALSVQCGTADNGDHFAGNRRVSLMAHNPRLYDRLCPGLRVRPLCGIEGPVSPPPTDRAHVVARTSTRKGIRLFETEASLASLEDTSREPASSLSMGSGGAPGFQHRSFRASNGLGSEFKAYVPTNLEPGRSYGLAVYLHGDGAADYSDPGTCNAVAQVALKHGMIPVFVLSPTAGSFDNGLQHSWWNTENPGANAQFLDELIKSQLLARYNIDKDRVVFTGQSGGSTFLSSVWLPQHGGEYQGGAVLFCGGSLDQSAEFAPRTRAGRRFRLHFVNGTGDFLAGIAQRAMGLFRRRGLAVTSETPPGYGHCEFPRPFTQMLDEQLNLMVR